MVRELRFAASRSAGEVSALLERPRDAQVLFVFGHGAGAGMRHPFMEGMARAFAAAGIATLRYQFPYMERGRRVPSPAPILKATVRAAVDAAAATAPGLPLLAGGKSMGGRMTSLAAADAPLSGVTGVVFLGFPLHPAGKPDTVRAEHLAQVGVPMLFLQGTRDRLAELTLLRPVCARLGERATLHVVDGADHGFALPKSRGRRPDDVYAGLASTVRAWAP